MQNGIKLTCRQDLSKTHSPGCHIAILVLSIHLLSLLRCFQGNLNLNLTDLCNQSPWLEFGERTEEIQFGALVQTSRQDGKASAACHRSGEAHVRKTAWHKAEGLMKENLGWKSDPYLCFILGKTWSQSPKRILEQMERYSTLWLPSKCTFQGWRDSLGYKTLACF